jgi:hypothetical protein
MNNLFLISLCYFKALGGGLAMITGAQEKIPAVGVSGPNNEISRLTFNPPISVDALNKYSK